MSPPPELESFAANVYYGVAPVAGEDAQYDYALAKFSGALGVMFQAVEDLARDTPEGPGWSAVVDVDRCPDDWIPWLGQFVGVSQGDRQAILTHNGFQRGTPDAIRAAAGARLTGSKLVILQERLNDDAYLLGVYTIDSETPDPAGTLADLLTQKPGGIVLEFNTGPPNTYQAIYVAHTDYADVDATYTDYGRLAVGVTG